MTRHLKAAKRVLLAAGFTDTEISELVRGIKADAWDKGHGTTCDGITSSLDGCEIHNPYRAQPPHLETRQTREQA